MRKALIAGKLLKKVAAVARGAYSARWGRTNAPICGEFVFKQV